MKTVFGILVLTMAVAVGCNEPAEGNDCYGRAEVAGDFFSSQGRRVSESSRQEIVGSRQSVVRDVQVVPRVSFETIVTERVVEEPIVENVYERRELVESGFAERQRLAVNEFATRRDFGVVQEFGVTRGGGGCCGVREPPVRFDAGFGFAPGVVAPGVFGIPPRRFGLFGRRVAILPPMHFGW